MSSRNGDIEFNPSDGLGAIRGLLFVVPVGLGLWAIIVWLVVVVGRLVR